MGYTHYWTPKDDVTDEQWKSFTTDVRRVIKYGMNNSIPVAWEYDELDRPPEITDTLVRFNGVDDDGHETFYFERSGSWAFCKTACKPYDTLVVACLILAENHFGLQWSSDGRDEDGDFDDAKNLLNSL